MRSPLSEWKESAEERPKGSSLKADCCGVKAPAGKVTARGKVIHPLASSPSSCDFRFVANICGERRNLPFSQKTEPATSIEIYRPYGKYTG